MTLAASGMFSWPSTTTFIPQKKSPAQRAKRQKPTKTDRTQFDGAQNNKRIIAEVITAAVPATMMRNSERSQRIKRSPLYQRGGGGGKVIKYLRRSERASQSTFRFATVSGANKNGPGAGAHGGLQVPERVADYGDAGEV